MDPDEPAQRMGYGSFSELLGASRSAQSEAAGWEREKFGMSESGANARAAAAERGATSRAKISANAQLAAAKMQHSAAMARLERLDIPQMEINRMDVEGKLRIAEMAQRLNEQQLGVDVIGKMTELGAQPANWLKTANYARGVSQSQVPQFLESLVNSSYMAPFTSGVAGAPGANSLGNVLGKMGVGGAGGASGGAPDMDMINSYIDRIGQNPHQYDISGLTDTERQMFGGALSSRGFDPSTWGNFNERSGVKQGSFSAY